MFLKDKMVRGPSDGVAEITAWCFICGEPIKISMLGDAADFIPAHLVCEKCQREGRGFDGLQGQSRFHQ